MWERGTFPASTTVTMEDKGIWASVNNGKAWNSESGLHHLETPSRTEYKTIYAFMKWVGRNPKELTVIKNDQAPARKPSAPCLV